MGVVLRCVKVTLAVFVVIAAVSVPVASASVAWSVQVSAGATDMRPGGVGSYSVLAKNVGTGRAGCLNGVCSEAGEKIVLTDTLPAGLTATGVQLYVPSWSSSSFAELNVGPYLCTVTPVTGAVRCEIPGAFGSYEPGVAPGQQLRMVVEVSAASSVAEGPAVDEASVEGAGVRASGSGEVTVSSHPPVGITEFGFEMVKETEEEDLGKTGTGEELFEIHNKPYDFTQAGGHPWALTTSGGVTSEEVEAHGSQGSQGSQRMVVPTHDPKDFVVTVPPGLIGDPLATPRCSLIQFTDGKVPCPADTQLGVYVLRWFGGNQTLGPIVNITPEAGQSAEFGLEERNTHEPFLLTAHLVHTEQGYGFTVTSDNIPYGVSLTNFHLTFWGVPADSSHDGMRGRYCNTPLFETFTARRLECRGGKESAGTEPVPFLSLPTDCSAGPTTGTFRADSWAEPGSVSESRYTGYAERSTTFPAVTGCNSLQFNPSIRVEPDTLLADAPVGLDTTLEVPQNEQPEAKATPQLRDAVVTLPEGVSISPGIVDGIQACDESGPEGINVTGRESEEVGLSGELQLAPGHCPNASTVGTAEAITPLLPEPVRGHVYLAKPGCGGQGQSPCTDQDALDGNLYKLYLELGGAGKLGSAGIHIKVPGFVEANPATGQLTTKFLENPQTPFSELHVSLNGGPRAPLDNPAVCGSALTTADFTPWSEPGVTPEGIAMTGTPDATPSSFYGVNGCAAGGPPFKPGFTAGTVTTQAGAFTPFTLNLTRQDREQYVKGVQVRTPPGLLGMLSSVPLCGEGQAQSGACPETSQIGTTRVASGAGSHPFEIAGKVYLTGPYDGAPFGLSIVTNAIAGPFNLGLVIVRARIDVDPETSTLTVTTDETGPHAIPRIVFGVPLRLQRITVNIDRPGFMFNPTNCGAQQVTATVSGSQNATATVQSPFAVGGCKSLAFKPGFTVSTSGHTSRAGGASLDAKLSFPAGSVGNEANIARVKVDLPKQLPSRLTTLQKACTAQVFAANPANCPAASIVGIVRASTPLLPVGLSGPVYFVSHGGEAFPSLIVVLQGDGVRVDLTGSTFISRTGITSSTFKTVPDVPVSTFELYLPEGKFSALAANGNLCAAQSKLKMPTEMVAQNGAVIHQTTTIQVTGCAKAKRATKKTKAKKKASRARKSSHGQGRKS